MVIFYGYIINYPKTHHLKATNVTSWFLWVRYLGTASLGSSCLGSLVRVTSWCWLALQSSASLTKAGGSTPRRVRPHDRRQETSAPRRVGVSNPALMSSWHGSWLPPEQVIQESKVGPGHCGLFGWGVIPYTKRLGVRFPVKAHT